MANAKESAAFAEPEIIYVSMLGRFELRVGENTVTDNTNRAHQLWNLLEYLVAFRNRDVSHEELIAALWPEESSDNPASALKNLIYRIRSILASSGIACGKDLIVHKRGTYSWNNRFHCVVDTEEFERLAREASDLSLPVQERIERYLQALEYYKGDFLPKSAFEEWVVPLSTYYHGLYIRCVTDVIELLMETKRYEIIVNVCEQAILIDQFEEPFHEALIKALVAQGKQQKAMAHYEQVTSLFYRELGVRPSENLRGLYREIIKNVHHVQTDLEMIKEDLQEASRAEGAFFCEYEVFKNMYQLEARSAARTGQAMFVGLLTMTNLSGEVPDLKMLDSCMEKLQNCVRVSLRRGDVVSRFSPTQFVLMLPTLTFENGQMVMERIVKRFRRDFPRLQVMVQTNLQPLDPVM